MNAQQVFTLGQEGQEGEGVCIVEAMKMQTTVYAQADGTVDRIPVAIGDSVDSKNLLLVLR